MKAIIDALVRYAEEKALIAPEDRIWAFNRILEVMQADSAETSEIPLPPENASLPSALLDLLADNAAARGLIEGGPVSRDLFDTKLMGALTPPPHEVRKKFSELYTQSPEEATDWYYAFSQNTNYIRRDRIEKTSNGCMKENTERSR